MNNPFFQHDVKIVSQSVRGIKYVTDFGNDLEFDDLDMLSFNFTYDVLTHKDNPRDHIIAVEVRIDPNNPDKIPSQQFRLLVEGNYFILPHIPEEAFEQVKQHISLAHALSFLKAAVLQITSLTYGGGLHLPLIEIDELHKQHQAMLAKKAKRKAKNK